MQDLKDFARSDGLDVVYSEIGRGRDGTGYVEKCAYVLAKQLTVS